MSSLKNIKSQSTSAKVLQHFVVNFLIAIITVVGFFYFLFLRDFISEQKSSILWYFMDFPYPVPSISALIISSLIIFFVVPSISHTYHGLENIFLDYIHHKNARFFVLSCVLILLLFLFV